MRLRCALVISLAMACLLLMPALSAAQDKEQWLPLLCYRTGPYAPGGSGICGGMEDYFDLLNLKGGIDGIKLKWEECETAYSPPRGVECYERTKKEHGGAIVYHPISTGITYALMERATADKIPLTSIGYGRADAQFGGEIFPYTFPLVTTYWSQVTGKINYIASKEGGLDKLKGKKIALLYIDVAYGQETIPILKTLAEKYGFELGLFPVPAPGLEQSAQWLDIKRRFKADWVINRNWGISCTVPLKEAVRVGFSRDRIIGVWWCGSEEDVVPAGPAAKDYITTNFHGVGQEFPIIQEILENIYMKGKGNLPVTRVGTVYYNRGVIHGIITAEALRTAYKKFGAKPINGEQMKWALENLNIDEKRIKELGAEGFMPPLKTSPTDHEGGGWIRFQQWDGAKWKPISDWIAPMRDVVQAEVKRSAEDYAAKKGEKK
ncbi:MAG: ABC transporter substrate-binding protein [Deltaproteobacteria bacterium]|nr:ABC transporter substrate-binding protein [Deltaproteobacteria bacterium]